MRPVHTCNMISLVVPTSAPLDRDELDLLASDLTAAYAAVHLPSDHADDQGNYSEAVLRRGLERLGHAMTPLQGADPVARLQEPRVCGLLLQRPAGTGTAHWETVCWVKLELLRADSLHGMCTLTPVELHHMMAIPGYTLWVVTTPSSAAAAGAAVSRLCS